MPRARDSIRSQPTRPMGLHLETRHRLCGSLKQNNDCGLESVMDEQGVDFYDSLHTGGYDGARYLPLFRKVVQNIRDRGSRSLLEVGCGSGFLAEMLLREHAGVYRGFDFSTVAIRNAGYRTGRPELFCVGDALDARSYACDYDTILCTEVLEHVDADLSVIRLWRDGTWCVCTVPNF